MNEMNASIERLQNSRIVPDFTWWEGEVFVDLAKQVGAIGPGARVRMFQGLKENGLPDVWFVVVSADLAEGVIIPEGSGGGTNDSRPCPPLC